MSINNNKEKDEHFLDGIVDDSSADKKKIIRYSLIIGIPLLILVIIILIIVCSNSTDKETPKEYSEWDNLIPSLTPEELKKLISSSFNITNSLSQTEIQSILKNNTINNIHFVKGVYNIAIKSGVGLLFKKKDSIIFDKGVIFNVTGEPFKEIKNYNAIRFVGINATKEKPMNVYGTIEINGNRNPEIDKSYGGEWGMGMGFYTSHYVNIEEIISYNNHGDGIYFGTLSVTLENGTKINDVCSDINIRKITCRENYRNGISVISGEKIKVNEMYVEETYGTPPEAGIDFEPNYNYDTIDWKINKVYSKLNRQTGMTISGKSSRSVKVYINEYHSDNDGLSGTYSLLFVSINKNCSSIVNYAEIKNVTFVKSEGKEKYKNVVNYNETCAQFKVDSIEYI